jgi:hypothetical protein
MIGRYLVVLTEVEYGEKDFHAVEFESMEDAEKYTAQINTSPDYVQARIETDPRKFGDFKRFLA